MDGDVVARIARTAPGSSTVHAHFYMAASPSEISLGHLEFDLADDAELIAYAMVLRLLQRGGVLITSRSGVEINSAELEAILEQRI